MYARLAQSVERGTFNPEVKGSSPLSGGDFYYFFSFNYFSIFFLSQVYYKFRQ